MGKKVLAVTGNTREPIARLKGQTLLDVGTWGKHLLFFFSDVTMKIHFLMWGSYSVDTEKKNRKIRLGLTFPRKKLFFYACSVKFLDADVEVIYDWSADVMSPSWDEDSAIRKVKALKDEMVCDVLLNQQIFSGVGNIIKNEVLFILRLHPERRVQSLSARKITQLVREAHDYSWKFYEWKMAYELKKHWLIMRKKICPNCNGKVTRRPTGKGDRLSHYCERCQK
ncbi:MAG: DNA-formamidopyrimidine glycosylase family protein [Bdellovibrionales bacterium]